MFGPKTGGQAAKLWGKGTGRLLLFSLIRSLSNIRLMTTQLTPSPGMTHPDFQELHEFPMNLDLSPPCQIPRPGSRGISTVREHGSHVLFNEAFSADSVVTYAATSGQKRNGRIVNPRLYNPAARWKHRNRVGNWTAAP